MSRFRRTAELRPRSPPTDAAAEASRKVRTWIREDRLLTEEIRKQAAWYGLRTCTIDDRGVIDELAADVAAELGLATRQA